jgi:hypothetical protein
MACSCDHYRRREKTIHEFRKQRDAHLNAFRRYVYSGPQNSDQAIS